MTQPVLSPIDELKQMVSDQKKINLPPQAEDPDLESLHSAAVDYDQAVSQLVIAVIQGRNTAAFDQEHIREQAVNLSILLNDPDLQANRKIEFYRTYKARLDRMRLLASQVGQE